MKILAFAEYLGKLKLVKRTGWVRSNVPQPESVAEHTFRVALLGMILAKKLQLNEEKVIKMALLHDVGEAEIGDIVTVRGGKRLDNLTEKIKMEREALHKILSLVDEEHTYINLFDEYEENKTPEARLVKQLDKLEMGIQAMEYEKAHEIKLDEFFDTSDAEIVDENLRDILREILSLRKNEHGKIS